MSHFCGKRNDLNSQNVTMLPKHGRMECRACFYGSTSDTAQPHHGWRMINDPGAWGSENPEFLVLGFSKGATQAGIFQQGRFEDIAFAGMRTRLTQALKAINVLSKDENADEKISSPDSNIAFGSLIRCSVSRRDEKSSEKSGREIFACTGALITKSFSEIPQVIKTCSSRFLVGLPQSVKAVIFLGNSDKYVEGCQALIKELFPSDFIRVNPMAVQADGRVWVHLAHPSGLNGHFNTWLSADVGSGIKRIQARHALKGVC